MSADNDALALESIRFPVHYDAQGIRVADRHNETVLDIRGWGRLAYVQDGAQRQDAIGALVARLLNDTAANATVSAQIERRIRGAIDEGPP